MRLPVRQHTYEIIPVCRKFYLTALVWRRKKKYRGTLQAFIWEGKMLPANSWEDSQDKGLFQERESFSFISATFCHSIPTTSGSLCLFPLLPFLIFSTAKKQWDRQNKQNKKPESQQWAPLRTYPVPSWAPCHRLKTRWTHAELPCDSLGIRNKSLKTLSV